MKRMILLALGVGLLGALGAYLYQTNSSRNTAPADVTTGEPSPVAEPATEPATSAVVQAESTPARTPTTVLPQSSVSVSRRAVDISELNRTVDLLVSPLASFGQKHEAWRQLKESGKLDQAIAELEQRVASDPQTATYPAALGQAYLQKCATIKDVREQGILAMQADKMFDSALNLDPANWEARFTKAVAMSYWPPMLNKGDEVIQHFQTLIQQQETQAPQPQFAQTYSWLGDQYQKMGRADDALTVWQRGASLFPDDESLRKKIATGATVRANSQ